MDDRELDERIANLIDAEYIVKQFGLLDEKQKEELAQDISRFMYDRQADLRSPKNTYTPRYLWQGQDINHADTGRTMAVGHAGPTVPRVINLESGFLANLTQNDPQQLNLRSAGGGADCMFNFLVSSCFATLNGFTEGQVFTSLSGCTFKGYSTVAGAVTQANIDFPSTTPAVIAICPGTYAESVSFAVNQYVRILGAGREAVTVGGLTGASVGATFIGTTGLRLWITGLTIKTNHATSGTASSGLKITNPVQVWVWDCELTGNSSGGTGEYAIDMTETGANGVALHVSNCRASGNYGINVHGINGAAQIADSQFTNCTEGIALFEDCLVTGNSFESCTVAIRIATNGSDNQITGNHFVGNTTDITCGTNFINQHIIANTFSTDSTFLDVSTVTGGATNNSGSEVKDNHGSLASSGVFIKFPAGVNWQGAMDISGNTIDAVSGPVSLYTGLTPGPSVRMSDNTIDSSTTTTNVYQREPIDGQLHRAFTGGIFFIEDDNPLTIGVTPCVIRFGDTDVAVTRQTVALTASATNYIEINSAGTLSANTTAFTAGTYHVIKIVTGVAAGNAIYSSYSDTGGLLYVGSPASGGTGPAPNSASFVTMQAEASLTAERVLTPQSSYTPVGGVGFIDGGANSTVTATLKDLTANWTQSGAFNISQVGGHLGVGASGTATSDIVCLVAEAFNDPGATAKTGIQGTLTSALTANSSANISGLSFTALLLAQAAGLAHTGVVYGARTTVQMNRQSVGNVITASDLRNFDADATVNTGQIATIRYGYYCSDTAGSGTVTTQYGFYVPTFTKGGTNWAFYNAGTAASAFGGSVQIGGTTTPATTADIRGAVTLDGVSAPSTPASDDGVLYNETGTDFLKYKEDNAAVYNLTHKHLWDAAVDVTTASTTVPPMLVGPMPNDGTIVNVYAKLTDNKTNGATSSIFDIHKILLANANTDGQGTTIYTTQANRPTISNGNMYTAATAPDVTTFSAGDWFAIYVDQTGTTATFAVVGMHVRYT